MAEQYDDKNPESLVDKVKNAAQEAALKSALAARTAGKSDLEARTAAWQAAQAKIPAEYERLTAGTAVSDADKKALAEWDWGKDATDALGKHDEEEKKAREAAEGPHVAGQGPVQP
jgi:hypothetical protein